ncbi:Y9I2 [Enterospora canceri]|uniref:Y9I2 n=1 Tax=Enterospora canceri TaxID=1081671 RepID=A0A1Y1S8I6_9MICR|nr:Y9I2 [Enterospora canceri]
MTTEKISENEDIEECIIEQVEQDIKKAENIVTGCCEQVFDEEKVENERIKGIDFEDENKKQQEVCEAKKKTTNLIAKIMKLSGCNKEIAEKSIKESKNNTNNAIDIAKRHYRETLPTIFHYKNGLEVKYGGKESFYDFKTDLGKRLVEMIGRGEFDRKLLGMTADFVDVIYVDLKKEKKLQFKTYDNRPMNQRKDNSDIKLIKQYENVLPNTLQFDELYDTQFKLCYKKSTAICKLASDTKLRRVYNHLREFFKKDVLLVVNGEEVGELQTGEEINKKFVVLYVKQ